jgi:hypothetical protein
MGEKKRRSVSRLDSKKVGIPKEKRSAIPFQIKNFGRMYETSELNSGENQN